MITKRKIKVPIYNFIVDFTVFDEWKEITEWCDNTEDEREGFILTDVYYPNIIKMFTNSGYRSNIVHEIIHIKNQIFSIIGQKVDIANDETEAYLVEYLYKELVKVYEAHLKHTSTKDSSHSPSTC